MKTKKLLSLLLAIVMVVSMMAGLSVTASAAATDSVSYEANNENATGEVAEHHDDPLNNQHPTATITIAGKGTLAVEGYVFAGWNTQEDGKGTTYQPGESITISEHLVLYAIWENADDETTYLDLDENTTEIKDSKDLDQNYNLTVTEGDKTNVTKVKLTWEITDINAVRMDNKVWDTTELKWVVASSNTTVMDKGTAKFTLENYSSVEVDAKVTFDTAEYAVGKKFTAPTLTFDEATGTDGKITLDTANGNNTYSKENPPKGEIDVTVTPVADDFKSVSATTTAAKYGTYTVTISKSVATSFLFSDFFDGEEGDATVNGMNASTFCQYMVDHGMIADASEFGDVLVKSTYYSKFQQKNVTTSKALSLLFDTTHQEFGTVTSDALAGDNDYTSDKSFVVYFNGSFTWDGSAFVKNS